MRFLFFFRQCFIDFERKYLLFRNTNMDIIKQIEYDYRVQRNRGISCLILCNFIAVDYFLESW
jgi:hypothetical protein